VILKKVSALRDATCPYNAHFVLLKNSARSRPPGRNADYTGQRNAEVTLWKFRSLQLFPDETYTSTRLVVLPTPFRQRSEHGQVRAWRGINVSDVGCKRGILGEQRDTELRESECSNEFGGNRRCPRRPVVQATIRMDRGVIVAQESVMPEDILFEISLPHLLIVSGDNARHVAIR